MHSLFSKHFNPHDNAVKVTVAALCILEMVVGTEAAYLTRATALVLGA